MGIFAGNSRFHYFSGQKYENEDILMYDSCFEVGSVGKH